LKPIDKFLTPEFKRDIDLQYGLNNNKKSDYTPGSLDLVLTPEECESAINESCDPNIEYFKNCLCLCDIKFNCNIKSASISHNMQSIVNKSTNINHINFPVSLNAIKNFKNPLGSTSFYDNTNRSSKVSD